MISSKSMAMSYPFWYLLCPFNLQVIMRVRRWKHLTSWPKELTWVILEPEFLLFSFFILLQMHLWFNVQNVCYRVLVGPWKSQAVTQVNQQLWLSLWGPLELKWPLELSPAGLQCLGIYTSTLISHWMWWPWEWLQLNQPLKRLMAEGCAWYTLRMSYSAC